MNLLSEKVYVSGLTTLWPEMTRIPNLPHFLRTPEAAAVSKAKGMEPAAP
jgi:hypothetical protein